MGIERLLIGNAEVAFERLPAGVGVGVGEEVVDDAELVGRDPTDL
jgi:hypothetical protein